MPLFTNKVLAGSQFTGTTDDDGFFAPNPNIKQGYRVFIYSLRFHASPGAGVPTVSLYAQNPNDPDDKTLILSSPANDAYVDSFQLPALDGKSWPMVFETTGMVSDGFLSVDWDFVATRGVG